MHRILAAFLIALTLMPTWVCAMQSCPLERSGDVVAAVAAHPEGLSAMSADMPCHGEMQPRVRELPMLMMDCLDVDVMPFALSLQLVPESSLDDDTPTVFSIAISANLHRAFSHPVHVRPPPIRRFLFSDQSLYSSTQRLRI